MRLNRIGVKLVLAVAAVLALNAGINFWIDAVTTARRFRAEFIKTGRVHALTLAQAAEYGLLTADPDELLRVADTLHLPGDTELLGVAFYDEEGDLVAGRTWRNDPPSFRIPETCPDGPPIVRCPEAAGAGEERYHFRVPVQVSRAVVGTPWSGGPAPPETGGQAAVVTFRTYEEVKARIAGAQAKRLGFGVLIFGAFLALVFIMGRRLTAPIRRLVDGTKRVAAGDFGTRVHIGPRRDEFRTLADAFNHMTERLDRQHREIVSYSRDLEQKVERRTAELRRANEDLQRELAHRKTAQRALARSNAELRQFTYVASHDLQEPLRMVTSYVQLLARRYRGRLDAAADEFIAYAVDGTERMKALLNDVLQYSRVGRGRKPFAPVDCEAVLEDVVANLQVTLRERGAEVTHDPLPTVRGDRHQLGCVFQNLIGNAVKFCRRRPRVHVSAARQGDRWRFSVRDNGIGIDPAYRDRIFDVFKRLHGRDEYAGTGMGLAICKKIIERHGGTIGVESVPGQGSTFTFTLAVQPEEPTAEGVGDEVLAGAAD